MSGGRDWKWADEVMLGRESYCWGQNHCGENKDWEGGGEVTKSPTATVYTSDSS